MSSINFEELEDLRQSNIREAQYQLKRHGEAKFTISAKGKEVIGYDSTMGVNVKAGKGVIVIATLPKEDKRCTRGLLNGATGKGFTSNKLESHIQKQGLVAETYTFEKIEEYDGLQYFKIVPEVEDQKELETTPSRGDAEEEHDEADQSAGEDTQEAEEEKEEEIEVETTKDEF